VSSPFSRILIRRYDLFFCEQLEGSLDHRAIFITLDRAAFITLGRAAFITLGRAAFIALDRVIFITLDGLNGTMHGEENHGPEKDRAHRRKDPTREETVENRPEIREVPDCTGLRKEFRNKLRRHQEREFLKALLAGEGLWLAITLVAVLLGAPPSLASLLVFSAVVSALFVGLVALKILIDMRSRSGKHEEIEITHREL